MLDVWILKWWHLHTQNQMYKMLFAPQGEKLQVNCCFRLTLVLHAYVSEIF